MMVRPDAISLTDLDAENRIRKMKTGLLGGAALVLAGGLGIAAIVWAAKPPPSIDPKVQAAAIREALGALPTLSVTGTVGMNENARVSLAQPAAVRLEDGATVGLENGATVGVTGKVGVDAPPPPLAPLVTKDGDAIKRETTVFSSVEVPGGQVDSGWQFADGKAGQKPEHQFCYYMEDNNDATTTRTNLMNDGREYPGARKNPNFVFWSSKCVWWKPGDV